VISMGVLRVTVVLVTMASLLALVYYMVVELVDVWRAMTTLSYLPVTAITEKDANMLLVSSIIFSVLVILLLVAATAILHFLGRVL